MKMKDFDITMTHYNRGDIITGTIVMIGEHEVTVAIGGLREGVFPREELDGAFKLGDAILVMVSKSMPSAGSLYSGLVSDLELELELELPPENNCDAIAARSSISFWLIEFMMFSIASEFNEPRSIVVTPFYLLSY